MQRIVLAALAASLLAFGPAGKAGNVSIWDSGVPVVVGVSYPITGSGQIPGHFIVDTGKATTGKVQVGIRAQDRFDGPLVPSRGRYFADAGVAQGVATWNFDFHLDFGSGLSQVVDGEPTVAIGPTGHVMEDFQVTLITDCDPRRRNQPVRTDLVAFLTAASVPLNGVKLLQGSQNLGFPSLQPFFCGGAAFNPSAQGEYEFGIEVRKKKSSDSGSDDSDSEDDDSDEDGSGLVARTSMIVVVR